MGRREHGADDDEVLEDLIAGRRAQDDDLAAFVRSVRAAAGPVEPDDELRSLFDGGLDNAPETVGVGAPQTSQEARPLRRPRIWEGLVPRLAGVGIYAKIALGSAVAVAGATGAAVVVPGVAQFPGADVPMIDVPVDVREAEAIGARTAAEPAPESATAEPESDRRTSEAESEPEPRPPAVAKRGESETEEAAPRAEEEVEQPVAPTPKPSPSPLPGGSSDGSTTDGAGDGEKDDAPDDDPKGDEDDDGKDEDDGKKQDDDAGDDDGEGDGHEDDGDDETGGEDDDEADGGRSDGGASSSLDRRNYRVGGGA